MPPQWKPTTFPIAGIIAASLLSMVVDESRAHPLLPSCTGKLKEKGGESSRFAQSGQQGTTPKADDQAVGKVKKKVAPWSGPGEVAQMRPPIASTNAFAMARPTPEPPWERLRDGSTR